MSKKNLHRAQRLTVDEIATVLPVGVARALAARQTAAVELSAEEELAQVEGGISLRDPIIYGGPFFSSGVRRAARRSGPTRQAGPARYGSRVTIWLQTANPSARAPSPSGRARRCSEWSVGRQMRR